MENAVKMGMNRTGASLSPLDTPDMVKEAERTPPSSEGLENLLNIRAIEIQRAGRIGSVPLPTTLKGALGSLQKKLGQNKLEVLIDKLGERLAFERTGTRLYDGMLQKMSAQGSPEFEEARTTFMRIRDEEAYHFDLVRRAMLELGADPTALTPCADVTGVLGLGFIQSINDPRTTLVQGMQTLLIAEAADNEGWDLLISLTDGMGFEDLTQEFIDARAAEREHLETVRDLLSRAVLRESGLEEGLESPSVPLPSATPAQVF